MSAGLDFLNHAIHNNLMDAIHTLINKPELIKDIAEDDLLIFWQKCTSSLNYNVIIKMTELIGLIRKILMTDKYLPSEFLLETVNYNDENLYSTRINERKIAQAFLICSNINYGPLIYQRVTNQKELLKVLFDAICCLDRKDQVIYYQICEKYKLIIKNEKPILEKLLSKIVFDQKFTFRDNLKLRLLFNKCLHFMVAGRAGLGKSTLIRELFKQYLDEDLLPKASDGERGREEPFTVKHTLRRPFKEEEREFQFQLFPNANQVELTMMATDIGGFSANVDKGLSERENDLIKMIDITILKSFNNNTPINMLIYFVDDRFLPQDALIIEHCSYIVPVIIVKSKSINKPSENYLNHIRKYPFHNNDNCQYLYPILAQATVGYNDEGNLNYNPQYGFEKLTDVMTKVYYNNNYREHYIEHYIGRGSPEYEKYLKERTRRAWAIIGTMSASAGVMGGFLPTGFDVALFIAASNSMIGVINMIYNINLNLDVLKIMYAISGRSTLAAVVVTAGTGIAIATDLLLKSSVIGYVLGSTFSGIAITGAMTYIGYSVVDTYNKYCLTEGNNIHDITEKYILDNIYNYSAMSEEDKVKFEEFKKMVEDSQNI